MAETYGYDADGVRVSRTRAGVTTVYLGGAWEQDVQSGASTKTRAFVTLQGRCVCQAKSRPCDRRKLDHALIVAGAYLSP